MDVHGVGVRMDICGVVDQRPPIASVWWCIDCADCLTQLLLKALEPNPSSGRFNFFRLRRLLRRANADSTARRACGEAELKGLERVPRVDFSLPGLIRLLNMICCLTRTCGWREIRLLR